MPLIHPGSRIRVRKLSVHKIQAYQSGLVRQLQQIKSCLEQPATNCFVQLTDELESFSANNKTVWALYHSVPPGFLWQSTVICFTDNRCPLLHPKFIGSLIHKKTSIRIVIISILTEVDNYWLHTDYYTLTFSLPRYILSARILAG